MEQAAREAVSCSIPLILTHIGYSFNCKTNVGILEGKVTDLGSMRDGIERYVQTARGNGDLIKPVVERWLNKVITVQGEATVLILASEEINEWFQGWWSLARYHLGKDAQETINILNELLYEGKNYSSSSCVSDPALVPGFVSSGDFQAFASRESTTNQIIKALEDENINRVGVWGMGGVGKTTLMKELGKRVRDDQQLFERVVMVTVSQNSDLIKIQGELAVKLGIEFFASDVISARAAQLCVRLNRKKILIILDDIWDSLDLADLGISFGEFQKSCKVVLTTRGEGICNDMNTQKNIKVEGLSNNDSWNLFQLNAGDVVDSPVLNNLAREVANECKGLPLAIVTLGRALRGKEQLIVWEDAARQLKLSIYFRGKSPVFSSIKLSFDHLESEEIKHCFLFCCFFPKDTSFNVDDLMWCVMGEELLPNVDTIEDARRRLHTMLDKLRASCLLLEINEQTKCVMIHDVVRDATLSIAQEERRGFIVKAGLGLTRWHDRENLRTCKRLSLIGNKISELPDQPECPQLLSLSLSSNVSFTEIPNRFFERMTSLVALDLSQNKLSSLPSSLSCLVNLRTLCLKDNPLSDISLVGELKKLEFLNLRETNIQRLPEEIGGLIHLKFLDFSQMHHLKTIPQNVLSRLSCLEELYMGICVSWWKMEMGNGSRARLPELASLNLLTTLHLHVNDAKFLSEEISIFGEDLKKFSISIGREMDFIVSGYCQKIMIFTCISDPLANWVKFLLKKTVVLYLYDCQGLKSIVKLGVEGFDNLKFLSIEECHEMEYLTCAVEDSPQITFSCLEELNLETLNGFEVIYHGSLPNGFLGKLKILRVLDCKSIVYLFSCELLFMLQNLEELEISECDELKEIFHIVGLEEGHVVIPQLREINLIRLPSLTTILNRVMPLVSFQELNVLRVHYCGSLRYLFTRTMVQGLQGLEILDISGCSQMKKIIKSEEDEEEEIMVDEDIQIIAIEATVVAEREQDETVRFPRLTTLRLDTLPKLLSFYQPNILFEWPSLKELLVFNCPNLKKLPLGLQSATRLSRICGDNVEWFEGLEWEDQSVKSCLQPLLVTWADFFA